MAQVSRAAKPSDDWSEAELISFNIHITDVSQNAFLNTTDITKTPLPMPDTIFDNVDRPVGLLLKDVRLFFQYLKLVQSPSVSCGSRVNDFASFILRMLKFDEPDRVICQQMETTLPMENKHVSVTMDVCIMDEVEIFLIIHECKSSFLSDNPEPKIIAQAIAAFYRSNARRSQVGLPTFPGRYIPAIIMYGTAPVFYRVPVTTSFLDNLVTGVYPQQAMQVQRFVPPVPNQRNYQVDGMASLQNRKIIFQCFEALKNIIS